MSFPLLLPPVVVCPVGIKIVLMAGVICWKIVIVAGGICEMVTFPPVDGVVVGVVVGDVVGDVVGVFSGVPVVDGVVDGVVSGVPVVLVPVTGVPGLLPI